MQINETMGVDEKLRMLNDLRERIASCQDDERVILLQEAILSLIDIQIEERERLGMDF